MVLGFAPVGIVARGSEQHPHRRIERIQGTRHQIYRVGEMVYLNTGIINQQRFRVREETHERFGRFFDSLSEGVDALILIAYAFAPPASDCATTPTDNELVCAYVQRRLYTS